jgi:hypothetical protein
MRREHRQAVTAFFVLVAGWLISIITVEVVQSVHYTR